MKSQGYRKARRVEVAECGLFATPNSLKSHMVQKVLSPFNQAHCNLSRDTAFEDGLKMAWQHARQGVQCEDWQHERAGTEPLVCSRPPASLTRCACQADAQERPTQWKTSNTVKLARLTHS